jgi:hypothetical protein
MTYLAGFFSNYIQQRSAGDVLGLSGVPEGEIVVYAKHYGTERGILFLLQELDAWLMARTSPVDV